MLAKVSARIPLQVVNVRIQPPQLASLRVFFAARADGEGIANGIARVGGWRDEVPGDCCPSGDKISHRPPREFLGRPRLTSPRGLPRCRQGTPASERRVKLIATPYVNMRSSTASPPSPATMRRLLARLPCANHNSLSAVAAAARPFTAGAALAKSSLPPRPKPPPDADIEESFLKGSGPGGQKIVRPSRRRISQGPMLTSCFLVPVEQDQLSRPAQAYSHRHRRQVAGHPLPQPEPQASPRAARPKGRRLAPRRPEPLCHRRRDKEKKGRQRRKEDPAKVQDARRGQGCCGCWRAGQGSPGQYSGE